MLNKKATVMQCLRCNQVFDLLNSPWPKPEHNTIGLHTRGTGHDLYLVRYDNDTERLRKPAVI